MPDRDKVIKGLEHCSEDGCNGCPYDQECELEDGFTALARDAVELLKEQEAIEPINSYGTFRCGNCSNIVGYNDGYGRGYQNNFCSKCGKAVKWNGKEN